MDLNNKITDDFMVYSTAVIKSRAIPNIDDNLKPIHRRILYGMDEMKLKSGGKTTKVAKIVGNVMGTYHPHGDASIADALVRMSQSWKVRYPMVIVQGNNGSLNGDPAASMRYIEAKLSPIGEAILGDVDPDVVKYVDNYDNTTREPTTLPGVFPNMLCNGNEGIAVGMSCSILPHNLTEVVSGIEAFIKNPSMKTADLLHYIKGPDFPLGGVITNAAKLPEIYESGRGTLTLRAKYEIKNNTIMFSEFPYLVDVETKIISAIKKLVEGGNNDIEDYENHIGKDSTYIKVILNKKANPERVLRVLFDKTPLMKKVKINNTFIQNGVPVEANLLDLVRNYITTQHMIAIKRAGKEKGKQDHIAHINKGLLLAIASIDEAIKIIRSSNATAEARASLVEKLGVDNVQADAILKLQLGRLTRLDSNDIEVKVTNALKESAYQLRIMTEKKLRDELLLEELHRLVERFGDERRTALANEEEIKDEVSYGGVMVVLDDGTGVVLQDDELDTAFKKGGALAKAKPIAAIPYTGPIHGVGKDGTIINNYQQLLWRMDDDAEVVVTVTNKGTVKMSAIEDYKSFKQGSKLCKLRGDEYLIGIACGKKSDSILFLHDNGKVSQKPLSDFNITSRMTIGVKGTNYSVAKIAVGSGMFYAVNNEGKIKKVDGGEIGSAAIECGKPAYVGYLVPSYFYDTGRVYEVNWDDVTAYSRTAAGNRLNNKAVKWIYG